ncbi:hypothetical protein DSO57_1032195 [Entomophthora muscae]|uniref:Uncharacterized protein n=1 Tax=Entomophthora muscae TaxID=34485 RepID=A0ACC2RRE2_9FUNG|nr:hypothetical protein DSO57_1032195 [Entomophthora muscae]
MEDARLWQEVGVTTQLHKTLNMKKITLDEWELWRHTTSLAEAAEWIEKGFTPSTAKQWMVHKISPMEATFLTGKLPPEEAAVWLQASIAADQILLWKAILPDAEAAGAFASKGFTPDKATEWYDIGATATEASIFVAGGWNPVTVVNWLHTNCLKYGDINKFILPTIGPEMAFEWKRHGFSASEAIQ